MSNTVGAAATPGCAHISRYSAVGRAQLALQQQAVHISHDSVLYVENTYCYNTRLSTHLMTLCTMSNTASATTSHESVFKSKHTVSAILRTQRLFMFTHPQLTTAINFSADVVSSPTACSLRIRVQISLRRTIILIDLLLVYPQSFQTNVSIVPLSRSRSPTSSFCQCNIH